MDKHTTGTGPDGHHGRAIQRRIGRMLARGRSAPRSAPSVEAAPIILPRGKTGPLRSSSQVDALSSEIKRKTGQLEAIKSVINTVITSPDMNQTLQAALEAALAVVPLEASGISLVDHAAGELVMSAQYGLNLDFTSSPMRIKLGEGLSGLAVSTGELVIVGDVAVDPRLAVTSFAQERVKAMALVPMRARGEVVGVLSVMSHEPYRFSAGEMRTLRVIADQVGLALDNARLYVWMKAERSRLEAVLNSTADGIIATDDEGRINLVNQTAETFFNVQSADLMGRPLELAPFYPDMRPKIEDAMRALRDDPDRQSALVEVEMPDGRYYLGFIAPVFAGTNDGKRAWVIVFQDVTYFKQLEQERVVFIQNAAHDLRNPLSVTLGALQMLQRSLKEPTARQLEVLEIGQRGVTRMQELIDDMLDLEEIESGFSLESGVVDVHELVMRCSGDIRPVLERRTQSLRLDIDPALPPFTGDERWLGRALTNLLTNAHKYTHDDSTIIVRAHRRVYSGRAMELVLQVEDNGPGIPRDALGHLFERFYRAKNSEYQVKGTGLGLAIVKSVAEKHGGYVYVHSETANPGDPARKSGTTFGMVMPFRPAPVANRV